MRNLSISRIAFNAATEPTGPAPATTEAKPEAAAKPSIAVKRRSAKPVKAKPGKPATKAANKPAKRSAATTTPATDADKRAANAERVAADRATVTGLYRHFASLGASIPVKPVRGFKLETTTAHPIERRPSVRQAAAICAAFAASGRKLSAGGKAPRCFPVNDVPSAVENGVLRDAVSSGMLTVAGESPEAETLTLTKAGLAFISANIGEPTLKRHKLL